MKTTRDEWLCGYACALASVLRVSFDPSLAKLTLQGDGLSLKNLKAAGAEDFDLRVIKRCLAKRGQ